MSKNITIGILLVAIIVSGTLWYRQVQQQKAMEREIERIEAETAAPGGHWHGDEWHAEPHPEHELPAQTVTGAVAIEKTVTDDNRDAHSKWKRKTLWNSYDLDYPPEGAPRPLKHLSDIDIYIMTVRRPEHLTAEEVIQAEIELFFRMTKEERDEFRQERIKARAEREYVDRLRKEMGLE